VGVYEKMLVEGERLVAFFHVFGFFGVEKVLAKVFMVWDFLD
jgi:hypothetical protein